MHISSVHNGRVSFSSCRLLALGAVRRCTVITVVFSDTSYQPRVSLINHENSNSNFRRFQNPSRFHALTRSRCFHHTFIYLFAMMGQSAMFFMLILDLLFAVTIPHRMFTNLHYVFYMCLPPLLFAFVTLIFLLPRKIAFISYAVNGTNIATLVLLLLVFAAVRKS
uniref:Aa_trans domain-containing protein n=1 Tax=Angiostrongylus cantonensis TaxID=6313 RepID=A0A0K0DM95_ANGCA